MKTIALSLLLSGLALPFASVAASPLDDLVKQEQIVSSSGKYDAAIQLDEQILTGHPEGGEGMAYPWYHAQLNIAQMLAKKGDFAGAAKAAHICLDAAPGLDAFDGAVAITANILSALDKNVDRANQFIAFEQTGPAGGQKNPMDAIGYPSLPERESAFALMRQQAGDDAKASRFRAMTYLYSGKPQEALAQLADAFRRNENIDDSQSGGVDLVCFGLRAVRGHRVGLDQAMQFVIFGPNGPDGKPKTADDLTDPFAQWLPKAPPVGEGGLAGLDAGSLAVLRQVRDAVQLYAGDSRVERETRSTALDSLQRVNGALDAWGAPGQKDWYLNRALGINFPTPDQYTGGYMTGAMFAAKGRALHYGGIHTLWTEIDAECATKGIESPKPLEFLRKHFDQIWANLGQTKFPKLDLKPLKAPATF